MLMSRSRILRLLALVLPMAVGTTFLSMVAVGSAGAALPPCDIDPSTNLPTRTVNLSGTLMRNDCIITGLSTSGAGGGVENHGTMILTNVVISMNSGAGGGGGIYNAATGTMTLTNVVVTDNGTDGFGGGILNDGGTLSMTNVTVTHNNAGFGGGGLAVSGSVNGSGLAVTNNTTTDGDGGGILNFGSFCLSSGADFSTCLASPGGGNSLVKDNEASNGNGGGIANDGGVLVVRDSTVDHNNGDDGGGISTQSGGAIGLLNMTISNNAASGNGGGIFNNSSTVCCGSGTYASNLTIAFNTAGGTGGGVHTTGGGRTSLGSSTIARTLAGGGVYNDDPSFALTELVNTLLASNDTNCGGTIQSDGSNLDTDASCHFSSPGDQNLPPGTDVGLSTKLEPNGGPPQGSSQFTTQQGDIIPGVSIPMMTEALIPTSPAVDAGSPPCQTDTDERGLAHPRPALGKAGGTAACDIGAFELSPCLELEKTCAVVPPPSSFTCTKPITALKLYWTPGSSQVVDIVAWKGAAGGRDGVIVSVQCGINPGDLVTVTGIGGAQADEDWQIYKHVGTCEPGNAASVTGALLGKSRFKLDCSDPDMNSADDCGKLEGNNKDNKPDLLNYWILEGMTSSGAANNILDCHPVVVVQPGTTSTCVLPPEGGQVLYAYTLKNVGPTDVTGTLTDVAPGLQPVSIPFTIKVGGPEQVFTSTVTITQSTTNVATATDDNNPACIATDTATVNVGCTIYYPYTSTTNKLTSTVFNESAFLRAFQPDFAVAGDTIQVFANDEHALTLGVRQVVVKTTTGTTTTPFPIAPAPTTTPQNATNPAVGSTDTTGDSAAFDGFGRPMYPALFITDLTTNGMSACSSPSAGTCGDWQYGGVPQTPKFISGTWKGAVKTVDKTKTPSGVVTITPDADPTKNNWTLPGGDTPSSGFSALKNEGYGTEVRWNVDDLKVDTSTGTGTNAALGGKVVSLSSLAGHTFRIQFMVHDGDQNKTGGDVGQNCSIVTISP